MLSFLRKKNIAKRIIWVLAIIIIPAFVLWGAGNLGKKRRGQATIAFIGNRKITVEDFLRARRGVQIEMLLKLYDKKEELDNIFKNRLLLNQLAWENIIISEEAHKNRIKITDEEVIDFVTSQRLFINNGVFDERFYNYTLKRSLNINPRTFEEEVRTQLKINKMKDKVLKKVSATEDEVIEVYIKEFEKGIISYVIVDIDRYRNKVKVDQKEEEDYYNKFKTEFRVPQKVNLQYLEFQFKNPDEKKSIIEKIQKTFEDLKTKPLTFSSIAKAYDKSIEETGLFSEENLPPKFNWSGQLYKFIFNMNLGNMRVIIDEGEEGAIYLIKLREKIMPRLMTRQEALPLIRETLIKGKIEALARNRAFQIYNAIERDHISLEKAASVSGLQIKKTEFITRADYVEEVGEAYDILDTIFCKEIGVVLHPFETRKGFMIARLDAIEKIDKQVFEEKKEDYKEKVVSAKKSAVFKKWLEGISKNAQLIIDIRRL